MKLNRILLAAALIPALCLQAKTVSLSSPDGKLKAEISADPNLEYTVSFDGKTLIDNSPLSMTLSDGTVVGHKPSMKASKVTSVDRRVPSPFYRSTDMEERYNQITIGLSRDWSVEFRAYNDAVAYRFVSKAKKPFEVVSEEVAYNFPGDYRTVAPYVRNSNPKSFQQQFENSFSNLYTDTKLSELESRRLIYLPMIVQNPEGVNVLITEAGFYDYPGLFLNHQEGNSLRGVCSPYPKTLKQGGHNELQLQVKESEDYIAKVNGPKAFPWRAAIVSPDDKGLVATNTNYLLADPSRLADYSWVKPGKVAWDWWCDFNLDGVDFETGVNTATYKAFIDFAAKKGIEYVILDEGWAVNLKADLFQVVPEIDLQEIIDYGKEKGVGIILWAGYYAFDRDLEKVCKHYSEMGVKGFKVDFMNRDDQIMTDFFVRAAEMCAKYNLMLDYHGCFKPGGLTRTYPNVLTHEGVYGLEQMKWAKTDVDMVTHDVTLPFTRQVAGPMDYTQGAMRNVIKANYYPCYTEPMSQGTRCRQLAMYMIFESPLTMLCDSPSNYEREEECADFIAAVPTYWDETRVLDAKIGDYVVTARRKGDTWYIGGMTDWTPRDMEVDLSFLAPGKTYTADIFYDGANAHRIGRDYRRTTKSLTSADKLKLHLAPGGGFAVTLK